MVPEELLYTADHEWVRMEGSVARIGITDFAQHALGDIVYVSVAQVGESVIAGNTLGEVESTKSVSDIYAPVSGTVGSQNEALATAPELVNSDPYGEGWLLEIHDVDPSATDGLLDAGAYTKHLEQA